MSGGVCSDDPSIPTRPIKGGVCCEAGSRMTLLAIASHPFAIALGIVPNPTGMKSDRYDEETRTGCKSPRTGRHHRVVVVEHLRAVVYRGGRSLHTTTERTASRRFRREGGRGARPRGSGCRACAVLVVGAVRWC